MKLTIRAFRGRQLIAATFLFTIFIVQQSCTKIDTRHAGTADPAEKFFTIPAGTEPQVLKVINNLKAQNKLTGFISKLAQQEGYPVWNKVLASTKTQIAASLTGSSPDTLLYIPLVPANTHHVGSFIYARMNGSSMVLKLYRGREYEQFGFDSTNGENAVSLTKTLIMLDNKVFGATKFLINDRRLFADSMSLRIKPGTERNVLTISNVSDNAPSGSNFHYGWQYSTTCTQHEGLQPGPGLAGTDYHWQIWTECVTSVLWVLIEDGGGGGNGPGTGPAPDPGGGGGSGGGTPSNYPGNNQCTLIFNGELPPTCSGGGHNQGPVSTLDGDEPVIDYTYNPDQADNVILDTSITNNFPCVQNILDTLSDFGFNSLNKKAQIALSTMFGENTYQHITIKADPTMPAIRDADTEYDSSYTVGGDLDHPHYNFTIRVNPQMLNNATKEYIAATLTHEAMHAYINYLFKQYQFGLIDSNYIKNKFPIFWYGFPNANPLPSDTAQHNFIANNWVTEIENSLNLFTNNEMTQAEKDNVYRALSWGGLEKDSYVYQTLNLPDKFNIAAINFAARNRFQTGPYSITLFSGEVSPVFNFTASSLKLKNPCD